MHAEPTKGTLMLSANELRLPPVDDFRRPLMEPLGCLILHAAWFDHALIDFMALLRGPDTSSTEVAHKLRNWDSSFLTETIDAANVDNQLAVDLHAFIGRVEVLRKRRHRVVHDAIEVGADGNSADGYVAMLLREGFERHGKERSAHRLTKVTPEEIAAIACTYYDFQLEIDTFVGRLRASSG